MAEHSLIHSKLRYFNYYSSFADLVATNDVAQTFLEEFELIPNRNSVPPTCCNRFMVVKNGMGKLGWVWRCYQDSRKVKNNKKNKKGKSSTACGRIVNPAGGTLIDGKFCRLSISEVLITIISFVTKMKVTDVLQHLRNHRRRISDDASEISCGTVVDYYSYWREITEVVISNSDLQVGGAGMTVEVDETFLTKRKYNKGRQTKQMTVVVLGIYCREQNKSRFFRVKSKGKRDIWPYLKKYIHPDTSRICTDGGAQYQHVEKLFSEGTVHSVTNHSIGQYVDENDSSNTINSLENQNRLFKNSIINRRTEKLLHQYMCLFFLALRERIVLRERMRMK